MQTSSVGIALSRRISEPQEVSRPSAENLDATLPLTAYPRRTGDSVAQDRQLYIDVALASGLSLGSEELHRRLHEDVSQELGIDTQDFDLVRLPVQPSHSGAMEIFHG